MVSLLADYALLTASLFFVFGTYSNFRTVAGLQFAAAEEVSDRLSDIFLLSQR